MRDASDAPLHRIAGMRHGTPPAARDIHIRYALRRDVLAPYLSDPDTRIFDELGIQGGGARADIVVVNGETHAYEIKSTQDTLHRLQGQHGHYSLVFDRVTLVTASRHMPVAQEMVPVWWGIMVAHGSADGVRFEYHRLGDENPGRDARAAAEFLWRDETLRLLEVRGHARGFRDKPRRVLWDALCRAYTSEEIFVEVRRFLKERPMLAAPALRR